MDTARPVVEGATSSAPWGVVGAGNVAGADSVIVEPHERVWVMLRVPGQKPNATSAHAHHEVRTDPTGIQHTLGFHEINCSEQIQDAQVHTATPHWLATKRMLSFVQAL